MHCAFNGGPVYVVYKTEAIRLRYSFGMTGPSACARRLRSRHAYDKPRHFRDVFWRETTSPNTCLIPPTGFMRVAGRVR
jgi:hypothetical protein